MDRVTMLDAGEKTAAAPPSLFHRRIEFLPAKRLFTGFRNGGGGFRLETLNPTTSDPNIPGGSGQGIGRTTSGKRPDRVEASELARDPEFSFGFNLMKIGAGLENLGNTCFLNSVLQCLTYTEPLAAYLQSGRHKSSCRKAGFCALCAIQNHVSRALQLTGRSLAPKDLVSNLRCISRNFRNARQEDAHEYMVNLLESMHKCCLPSGVPSGSPSAFEKSLVHEIFGGRLRSQVKCMQCSFCSDKFDPFLDLSLEINKADSLHKALAHFTAKEYLDGGAREYQCQRCKQKVKALKQLSVHKAPYVLNIHLKRFSCHQPGQKIDKKVHFGPTLDLKPFVSGAYDGDLKYTLYGVLVHYGGNTHSGHYYCFVRTSSGMWYSLDDHRVCHVSEKRVLEEKAYMLFYVRDRKNVIPKKTVDVGHAKSMIINALGNRMQSESNRVPNKPFQNGAADKRVESLHPSPSLARVDVAVASALKETVTKGKSIQGSVQETVSVSSIGEDCSKQSPIIANGSIGGPSNVAFVTTGIKINERNKGRSTKNGPIDSVVASPKSDCLQSSVSKNYPSEVVNTPKNNQEEEKNTSDSSSVKLDCIGIHSSSVELRIKGCEEKASKTVNPSSQVKEQRRMNIEIGVSSKESTAVDGGKELEPAGLVSASINIPQKAPAHKRQKKLKKKFSQSRITLTRLSSGIILGAAFGVRKKIQKKKKFKQSALKIDIRTQEHLGPSTSEPTRPLVSTCNSQRKRSKVSSSKREKISNVKNGNIYDCNLVMGVTNEKLRDRAGQTEAAVAADKPPEGISSYPLARNGTASREDNILKGTRRDSSQNGIMNMLTRGLGETIVARWDEIEHHSSRLTGTSGDEPVSIGYIGDDWDEEYDKGKRKKVRTSVRDFGGPNPFQEIANQKAKLKRAKLDRFSSANQPFRI